MAENRTIEKKPRGKESEKKYFDKFIAMIVFSLFMGGMIGFFSMGIRDWLLRNVRIGKEVEALCDFSGWIVLGIYAAGILILSIITLCHYTKASKMSGKWDGENEAVIDVIEKKLDIALLCNSLLLIFNMLFFSLTIYASGIFELGEKVSKEKYYDVSIFPVFFGGCFIFALGLALNIIISKVIVDLEKKLNPEKQGSVFDMRFAKKWEASSDEAERQIMYKAAYAAFQAANMSCLVIWAIAVVIQLFLHTGVFPVLCICAIWLVLNVTYSRTAMKLQKYK